MESNFIYTNNVYKLQKRTTEDINVISDFSDNYKDEEFPNNITSLINFDVNTVSVNKNIWANLEWEKLSNFNNISLKFSSYIFSHVEGDIRPDDCIQGSIGNCYLICVASNIAEYPLRLKKIFVNKSFNKAGIYGVLFYINGQQVKIVIDDYIPIEPISKMPVFAQIPKSRNIWPLILEKAWAKYLGNYQNTVSGRPNEVMSVLCGAPSSYYNILHLGKYGEINIKNNCKNLLNKEQEYNNIKTINSNKEKMSFFNKIKEFCLNSYLVCASTCDLNIKTNLNNNVLGLDPNHAYTVNFALEFEASNKKIRLIKLRNPWGKINSKSTFEGEIIKNNYINYPEIKQNIGSKSDGYFVLTEDEFFDNFNYVYVCKYIDSYKLYSEFITPVCVDNSSINYSNELKFKHFNTYILDLKDAEYSINNNSSIKKKAFISVNKLTNLNFVNNADRVELGIDKIYLSIFVGKIKANQDIEYIGHDEGFSAIHTVELEYYENEEYIIFVHVDYTLNTKNNLNSKDINKTNSSKILNGIFSGFISVYIEEQYIFIKDVSSLSSNYNTEELFKKLLYNYYTNFKFAFTDKICYFDDNKLITKTEVSLSNSFYGFVVFENLCCNNILCCSIDYSIDNTNYKEGGLICSDINNNKSCDVIDLKLYYKDNFIMVRYKSGIKYKFKSIIQNNKSDNNSNIKSLVKSEGILFTPFKIKGKEMTSKYLTHSSGVIFYFRNNCESIFVTFKMQFYEVENLVLNDSNIKVTDKATSYLFEVILEPCGEYYLEIFKKDIFQKYKIKWDYNAYEFK